MSVFRFSDAIVRSPARSVVSGLRDDPHAENPTFEGIAREHSAYVAELRGAGLAVQELPPLESFPDSVFVEDPALVFPEAAILLSPGAPSRAGEAEAIAPALERRFDRLLRLPEGSADGGDILVTPQRVFIGLSARTDAAGAAALAQLLSTLGRESAIVATPPGTLHLKTASSLLDEETLIVTRAMAVSGLFDGYRLLAVPQEEAAAANALRVNEAVLVGAAFPRTIELLGRAGFHVVPLAVEQIGRLDAGLSCMSLRWLAGAS